MAFPPESFGTGYLATAAVMNANVRDNVNTLNGGGLIPVGLIGVWSGATSIIPSGWGLCDGGGGRLDLRDVFPIAAGGAYAVGATGGAASVIPASHSAHAVGQPDHATHVVGGGTNHPTAFPTATGSDQVLDGSGVHVGAALTGGYSHSGADLDSTPHGHGTGITLLPPYRAQAYMQKASSGLSLTTPHTWTTGEVPTAAQFNTELRDNINYLASYVLTLGTILIWGSGVAPPSGWQICDGTNGTPDLRDMFVPGAGNTYAVGATGGVTTQTLPNHTSHTPTQASPHTNHTPVQPTDHSLVGLLVNGSGSIIGIDATAGDPYTHHDFGVDAHTAHAGFGVNGHSNHDPLNILPPYYALMYMQLVSLPVFTTPRTWTTGETVQAAEFNTYIRDNENYLAAASIPLLSLAWWSGSIASIPANWSDVASVHDRFVVGAGNGSDGHYVPSQTGGATTVTPAAHPTHTVSQPSTHTAHVINQPADHVGNTVVANGVATGISLIHQTGIFGPNEHYPHSLTVDSGVSPSSHTHAFTVDGGAAHSAHAAITTLPPYKAVALMERLS